MGSKFALSVMCVFTLALSACVEPDEAIERQLDQASSALLSDAGVAAEVVFGDVIANNGRFFEVFSDRSNELPSQNWNSCPAGYRYVNRYFDSNGFWLCARSDLAFRTFYVGDVEANYGHFYSVSWIGVNTLASQSWDTCPSGTILVGHWFHSNGFWVCMQSWPSGGGSGGSISGVGPTGAGAM